MFEYAENTWLSSRFRVSCKKASEMRQQQPVAEARHPTTARKKTTVVGWKTRNSFQNYNDLLLKYGISTPYIDTPRRLLYKFVAYLIRGHAVTRATEVSQEFRFDFNSETFKEPFCVCAPFQFIHFNEMTIIDT
jgi:hypothetical protein